MKRTRLNMTQPPNLSSVPSTLAGPTSAPLTPPAMPTPHFHSLPGMEGNTPAAVATPLIWLWHGYLASGNLTLLTSQWKSGKTSLVAVLLARMAQGGELAGHAVKPGRAVI